eukprot:8053694-Lingulodinium_polyedra.AAC.1
MASSRGAGICCHPVALRCPMRVSRGTRVGIFLGVRVFAATPSRPGARCAFLAVRAAPLSRIWFWDAR